MEHMIHWGWIVAAIFGGAFIGFLAAGLCTMAKLADYQAELAAARKELEVVKGELEKAQ